MTSSVRGCRVSPISPEKKRTRISLAALATIAMVLGARGLSASPAGKFDRYDGTLDDAPSAPTANVRAPDKPDPVSPTTRGQPSAKSEPTSTKKDDSPLPGLSSAPRALADGSSGNGVSANSVALPGGASSVTGLGESFTTQLSTGIVSFSIPLQLPAARGGAQPRLDLSYSSGGGFGIAGNGWNIAGSAISRQADRGLPHYADHADWYPEQDRFVFGALELVPLCTVAGTSCNGAPGETMPPWSSGWQLFRARVEGGFLRFFWSPDHRTWRVNAKDGATFEFGVPLDGSGYTGALETNPDRSSEIYRWYMARQYDSEGGVHAQAAPQPVNVVVYRYIQDGGAVYLTDVFDTPPADPNIKGLTAYAHHTALAYEVRPDPVFSYRSGWLVEHGLRLTHVDVTSKPFTGSVTAARELVRRYRLDYDPHAHTSLLVSVAMEGRCPTTVTEQSDGTLPATSCSRLPPVTLEYQRSTGTETPLVDGHNKAFEAFDDTVRHMANSPPHSLDESLVGLMDVNSDGLPDVVATSPGQYNGRDGVFFNGGKGTKGFADAQTMGVIPVGDTDVSVLKLSSPNVSTLDLDADGIVNLVHMPTKQSYSVFHPEKRGSAWWWVGKEVTTASGQNVKIDFTRDARNVQVLDVNGDGLVDVVYSTPTEYQTFFALGRYPGGDGQFGHAEMTGAGTARISNDPVRYCTPWSAQAVRFSDADTQVADMNGDGLADIVRLRSGQILYWPGRGNGFFGTGVRDDCGAGTFGTKRHVEVQNAPQFGTTDPGTLLLNDVNADGFADLVEIRNDGVDVYLNDGGTSFTSRHTIEDTPIRPPGSNFVRLTDIDGSGTPDILWGEAYNYTYIDLTGGVIPYLLVRIRNGLGASTDLRYETSTDVMLEADAAGNGWKSRAPTVTPVLVQSTIRDNLERIGRPAGVHVTQYTYRDPVFEGRQREFRGFREADVKVLGDSNSPTSTQRNLFQLGECSLGNLDEPGSCDPESRWKDNWREALKGLPVTTEAFDEQGIYLSTEHTTYRLQQLYSGRDGRRVMVAYPVTKESFVYDTDPAGFDHAETSVPLPEVLAYPNGIGGTGSFTYNGSVQKRANAGTAHVRARSDYDTFGNMVTATRDGCIEGCPNGVDEAITATSVFELPAGDVSGWLHRETHSYITGSVNTAPRNETVKTYNARGKLLDSHATLSGTLALNRFQTPPGPAVAPAPPNASGGVDAPVQILLEQNTYDGFGRVMAVAGANGHCSSSDVDPLYAQVTIASRMFVGAAGSNGCGTTALTISLASTPTAYDRGLEATREAVDPNGQPRRAEYDGFGRVTQLWGPDPANPGVLAQQPSLVASYNLPADPTSTPYSIAITRTQNGANPNIGSYQETWSFSDGLGRTIASVSQANHDPADPTDDYIVTGAVVYNAKGGASRSYDVWFQATPPAAFSFAAPPPSNFTSAQYDAFGRVIATYGLDHLVRQQLKYHALSHDMYDAADLQGPRANTHATIVADGHGRGVQRIVRIRAGSSIEQRLVLNEYLPTGEIRRVIQRKAGATDVVRWYRYDSLGRLVANVEPNTSTGFNPDPSAALSGIKALLYAYADSGELVGTSDARGCGVNYHYDAGGRLLAEDRSPCLPEQAPYTAPNLTTGDGTEAFYRYDTADPETASIVDPAGQALSVNTSLLVGRMASSSGLGAKTVFRYDVFGQATGVGVRVVAPGAPSSTLSNRYAPRWYVQTTTLDAAGRATSMSSGVAVPQLFGADGQSRVTFSYGNDGSLSSIGGSYGTLLARIAYTPQGLTDSITLGDAAATQRAFTYNVNQQVSTVETFRAAAPFWSTPPTGYTAPTATDGVTQLELEHYGFKYDNESDAPIPGPGNIWKIIDYRSDADWPASAKPVTRQFQYDDLYRMTQATYTRANGGTADTWTSPYAAENSDATRKPQPSPHVSFTNRVQEQDFTYDWLGNVQATSDTDNGFWDRSLGATTVGTATNGPNRLVSASNRSTAASSTRKGDLSLASDASGNFTDLIVRRDGPCLPTGASCWQRYKYDWNEVGELVRARRWDLTTAERSANGTTTSALPARAPDADLRYTYDADGARSLKTAVAPSGAQAHTVYILDGFELRSTTWNATASPPDYDESPDRVSLRLPAGMATARVLYSPNDLPTLTSGHLHVFLELSDKTGSGAFVIDHDTGELVEAATYDAYGAVESDYRPGRWSSFREPYGFSGKEEDIEVGLAYFGARYYSPYLMTWMSPDPITIHEGASDINPYAYVHGSPLMGRDPNGKIFGIDDFLIGLGITALASAFIGAGTSIAVQAISVGWSHINWGIEGVAGAAITGAVTGAVTAGVGSAIGNALSASTSLYGALGTGTISGALGGATSYVTSSLIAGHGMSWGGLGKAIAAGGAGGLAGAAVGIGAGTLTKGFGGSDGLSAAVGAGAGGLGGVGGGLGVGLIFGDSVTTKSILLSLGAGLAGAMAGYGWKQLSQDDDSVEDAHARKGGGASGGGPRPPVAPEYRKAFAQIDALLKRGDREGAVDLAASLFKLEIAKVWYNEKLNKDPDPKQADALALTRGNPNKVDAWTIEVGPKALSSANMLASTVYHESFHVAQLMKGNWGRPGSIGYNVNEVEAYDAELRDAAKFGLTSSEIGLIKTNRQPFYDALDALYKARVDNHKYIVPDWDRK